MKNKKLIIVAFVLACCSCSFFTSEKPITPKTTANEKPQNTFKIPVYNSFDEFKYLLNSINDTVYVVNFWATWCKPCVAELPYFEALHEAHKNEAVKVVLVSLDFVGETQKVVDFIEQKNLQAQVVHLNDANNSEWIDKVHRNWSGSIPATYIYKNDKVAFYEQSFDSVDQLNELLWDATNP